MNIEQFNQCYKHLRDVDKIEVDDLCDHPQHEKINKPIGKGPAKKNILKHGGNNFICHNCEMRFNNPMNHVGQRRQTEEEITVLCSHPEHKGDRARTMKKSCYYGEMKEPYTQTCKSCAQLGKIISEEQREKISTSLTGIKRSEDFKQKLSNYMSSNPEGIARATKNLLENKCNHGMLGKTHSEETKQKMSLAQLGKHMTEEHRLNISTGRKKMLEETGGFTKEHRENLAKAVAARYAEGFDPRVHHLSGWYLSPKAGKVFYRSSYEYKAYLLLDKDDNIKTYTTETTQIPYQHPIKKITGIYLADINVECIDGSKKLIEVKPESWLKNQVVQAKIRAAEEFAKDNNLAFEVWTEVKLFGPVYNKQSISNFIATIDSNYEVNAKQLSRERTKTYYQKHIATDTVTVWCEYCQENHTPLRQTYEKNIAKHGHFVCEREGGHIGGSKPKLTRRKENPYAAEGKKACNMCKEIKPFEEFSPDKTKRDGYSTRCKACRRCINEYSK